MMKKHFYFLLMAALVCGLSLSVTSCKDDDKDNNGGQSEEQQEQQALEQQDLDNARIAVLDHLADIDEASDSVQSYMSQTFEPGIGLPDGDNESVRIVNTNTMELAAERFANIVGASIDEDTPSYTWADEKMGTMTYTKITDGTAWATVDVNIRQVPKLQKIIYRAPEMGDENGGFKGRAYYRFGDVVERHNYVDLSSYKYEYWVCVRPAFGPEGKEDSHWACFERLTTNNYFIHTFKDQKWWIPKGLGEDLEHMQNLAEMLYAILNPEEWEANVLNNSNNKKMKMFHDFDKNKEAYHNKYFWQNVCKGWDQKAYIDWNTDADPDKNWEREKFDIWKILFNTTKEEMRKQINDPNIGLNLLYKGYSWVSKKNLEVHLWQASYKNGTGINSNMHTVTKTEPKAKLKGIYFDCRKMGGDLKDYIHFFNNDGKMRWCVRFATGKELLDKGVKYSVKSSLFKKKVLENESSTIYRYYHHVDPEGGKDLNKELEPDMPL